MKNLKPKIIKLTNLTPVIRLIMDYPTDTATMRKIYLSVGGKYIYDLGVACDTCPFLFDHKISYQTKSLPGIIAEKLRGGLDDLDMNVISLFSDLFETDEYIVNILEFVPEYKNPNLSVQEKEKYNFTTGYHGAILTEFYNGRHWTIKISEELKTEVQEIVLPFTNSENLTEYTVESYRKKIQQGITPTAVVYSTIENRHSPHGGVEDFWVLTHFLMDGHHKIHAAEKEQKPITLLSFLSKNHSGLYVHPDLLERFREEVYLVDRTTKTKSIWKL